AWRSRASAPFRAGSRASRSSTRRASRCRSAAASTTSRSDDRAPAHAGVRLRRGAGARRAGNLRHAGRLGSGMAPRRRPSGGHFSADRGAVSPRRMGLRRDRAPPRRARPRLDGVGRDRRLPPRGGAASERPPMAGCRVRPVPRLRHRQAAADPLDRAALAGRLRRDVRRPGGGRLHAAGAGTRSASLLLMDELARKLGARLKRGNETLATAESCTGGWAAQVVTSVAGSSAWFERGFVTYSNAAKQELLGVRTETLRAHGAVSEETAREMARGALERSRATVAVSITGVAGPAGGTPEKPVGTVCFAWARGGAVRSETRQFGGDRESIRRQSVILALEGVMRALDGG